MRPRHAEPPHQDEPGVETTLGYTQDEVTNTPLLPLVHPADVPQTMTRMAEADRCERTVDFVNRYRRRDGRYRDIEWRAQRIGDVVLGRARDVTERRAREDAVRTTSRAVEDTLADLAQRVALPSADILAALQALGRTRLSPPQRSLLETLGRSVETLGNLVAELVDREREAGQAMLLPTLERRRRDTADVIAVCPELTPIGHGRGTNSVASPAMPALLDRRVRHWIQAMLRHIDAHPVFHRTFRDHPSKILGLLSIRLDHLDQFNLHRLQRLGIDAGLMSAGRTAALLARMQDIGFVDGFSAMQVGRVRRYRVQPAMTRAYIELLVVMLNTMAASDYRALVALEAIATDQGRATPILAGWADAFLRDSASATTRLNGVPAMAQGLGIALSIAAEAIERIGERQDGRLDIAPASYARRFDVSRAHVRRVIERLEPCGIVHDPGSSSQLLVTRRFHHEIHDYFAASCRLLESVIEMLI